MHSRSTVFALFSAIVLSSLHCGSDSGDGETGAPSHWTLTPRTTFEGFAVAASEIHTTARGLLGSFVIQAAAGEPPRHHVRLIDMQGKAAYDHDVPFDSVAGRLSEPDGESVFVSETAERIDEYSAKVRVRRMAIADGTLQDYGTLPEPMVNLTQRALHYSSDGRGSDGRLWCLGVNTDLVLSLYEVGSNTKIPIAERTTMDFGSHIVGLGDGFAIVTRSTRVDARFGVTTADQVAVLIFDAAGTFLESKTTDFPSPAVLGAVRVDETRVTIAGTLQPSLNDTSLFVRSWTRGPSLVPEAESTFDVGTDQVSVSALDVAPDGRWLAGGEVGIRQAETRSVIQGSRAFVATLSAAPAFALEGYSTFGAPERRNAISAFVRHPDGGGPGYAFVRFDFPKTHDADGRPDQAYSRTELHQLQLWSQ